MLAASHFPAGARPRLPGGSLGASGVAKIKIFARPRRDRARGREFWGSPCVVPRRLGPENLRIFQGLTVLGFGPSRMDVGHNDVVDLGRK